MKTEIKNRFSGGVLFAMETESLRLCVEAAVKGGADLRGACLGCSDLRGACLGCSDLRGADLRGADLRGADLRDANLRDSNLRFADLRGAKLRFADLGCSDLGGANLRFADLGGADLGGAKLLHGDTDLLLVGERPYLQIGPLGSRADTLIAFLTDHGVYVRAGCFWDTLDAFRAAVTETHGDNTHAQEYALAIALIDAHARLWTPAAQAQEAA